MEIIDDIFNEKTGEIKNLRRKNIFNIREYQRMEDTNKMTRNFLLNNESLLLEDNQERDYNRIYNSYFELLKELN